MTSFMPSFTAAPPPAGSPHNFDDAASLNGRAAAHDLTAKRPVLEVGFNCTVVRIVVLPGVCTFADSYDRFTGATPKLFSPHANEAAGMLGTPPLSLLPSARRARGVLTARAQSGCACECVVQHPTTSPFDCLCVFQLLLSMSLLLAARFVWSYFYGESYEVVRLAPLFQVATELQAATCNILTSTVRACCARRAYTCMNAVTGE